MPWRLVLMQRLCCFVVSHIGLMQGLIRSCNAHVSPILRLRCHRDAFGSLCISLRSFRLCLYSLRISGYCPGYSLRGSGVGLDRYRRGSRRFEVSSRQVTPLWPQDLPGTKPTGRPPKPVHRAKEQLWIRRHRQRRMRRKTPVSRTAGVHIGEVSWYCYTWVWLPASPPHHSGETHVVPTGTSHKTVPALAAIMGLWAA